MSVSAAAVRPGCRENAASALPPGRADIDPSSLLRASAWLLAAAAAFGTAMAGLRFGFDRPPPRWLRRAHGGFAGLGLAVLLYDWAAGGVPRTGAIALAVLALAAVAGIVTSRARRWRLGVSTEALAFAHLSVAALGYVMLLAAAIGGLGPPVTSPGSASSGRPGPP